MSTNQAAGQAKYQTRQAQLATLLYNSGLNALALNPGPSLLYLTGLHFHLMERPVVAIFIPHTPPVIILPQLEAGKTEELPFPVQVFPYGEDPSTWQAAFRQAAKAASIREWQIGIEPRRLRVLEFRFLEAAAPQAKFLSAEEDLAGLRMCKDREEISAMRKAVEIAQRALLQTLPLIKNGMTERDLASELSLQLLRAGSDAEFPFSPIVACGPNSANPHATPTQRPLAPGDLLLIDWGAAYEDYFSDLTRTFAIGDVATELSHIARVVQEANTAARKAIRPGIPASQVDQAARSVIEQAGYGKLFFHRTGHGLGMEEHEEPYIRSDNPVLLKEGMTFTIEPGIYLAGRGGVRIEDNVVVTASGSESLSDLPRELIRVG